MESNDSRGHAPFKPEILAPAGDKDCFLAALAAGADAIYLGLKNFSARMEAENFGLAQLSRLIELAHGASCRVYVAMNGLIKPNELGQAYRLARRLATQVPADGIILQDPAMLDIALQAGFGGQLALSTLANVSNPAALEAALRVGASRVILPRELSIDEMRQMDAACPQGLELECFVHGALCYCVSGRCYWSSYLGGRSGLRGRCAQPCRRVYARGRIAGSQRDRAQPRKPAQVRPASGGQRYFSCQDLEIGALTKILLECPRIACWKIEGRKKGPHYVFHTVTAYKMLRDNPSDPQARKMALEILELALGRPGVKGRFLPQDKSLPMAPGGQTSSGRLAGKISVGQNGVIAIKPHFDLLPRDYLRVGVEDEKWHATLPVTKATPKGANLVLRLPAHKTPKAGTPVFLIDRREPELTRLLNAWDAKLRVIPAVRIKDAQGSPQLPRPCGPRKRPDIVVRPGLRDAGKKGEGKFSGRHMTGLWLSRRAAGISRTLAGRVSFWLPPVLWPEEEERFKRLVDDLWRSGARHFVCNAPWQRALFPAQLPADADLTAGPFCNIANPLAVEVLARMGFCAAFCSPELPSADALALAAQSPLPLGYMIYGYWPVGISRFGLSGINANEPFFSPKGETFWSRDYGGTIWIYPAWPVDLQEKKKELQAAGYSFFAYLDENAPQCVPKSSRPGLFNWEGALL